MNARVHLEQPSHPKSHSSHTCQGIRIKGNIRQHHSSNRAKSILSWKSAWAFVGSSAFLSEAGFGCQPPM